MSEEQRIECLMKELKNNPRHREKYQLIMSKGGYYGYLQFQNNLKVKIAEIYFDLKEKKRLLRALSKVYQTGIGGSKTVQSFAFNVSDRLTHVRTIKKMMKIVELYEKGEL